MRGIKNIAEKRHETTYQAWSPGERRVLNGLKIRSGRWGVLQLFLKPNLEGPLEAAIRLKKKKVRATLENFVTAVEQSFYPIGGKVTTKGVKGAPAVELKQDWMSSRSMRERL